MKGFTLLEILVTVLIFGFIIVGMYGVLNITQANYSTNSASLNLQQQARQGMSWLSREIRQASWDSIDIVPTPPDLDANNNNSITFNTPGAVGVEYFVTWTLVSGRELWQLKREHPTGTYKIIANDIRGLNFLTSSGNIVNIQVQASKTFRSLGKERTLAFPLTEQVTVRNP